MTVWWQVDPNDQNGPDLETKIEEMKQNIRRAETAKTKAEARIECLRAGGVNVDEWLQEAESLNVQDIQRSASSLSVSVITKFMIYWSVFYVFKKSNVMEYLQYVFLEKKDVS